MIMKHLFLALSLAFSTFATVYAADTPAESAPKTEMVSTDMDKAHQAMMSMKHVNPLPNYIVIVRKEAEAMKLTDEQKAKANEWFEKNNANAAELVKKIIAAEQAMADSSMQGATKEELLKQFDEMVALRRTMVENKTACRDYLKEVLTPEQWTQLMDMQKATLASAQ